MSRESLTWLNQNTLIGFTGKRGTAWHYRAAQQGDEPNHYPGPIPVADVKRRLFHWEPVEGTIETAYLTGDGVTRLTDPTRKAIIRPDTGRILGVFKQGFRIHEYKRWLVDHIETILDDELSIGSAGLLKDGAVAWVQVELPETCTTPEGIAFRPFLSAATSLDGSLSSTYQTGAQLIVCDNTLSAALASNNAKRVKIKHSRRSLSRVVDVRDALGIIHQAADDFAAEVKQLCQIEVSRARWSAFLDEHAPVPAEHGRSRTIAQTKRLTLNHLWNRDQRVSPWRGTAFGVVQAVNTYTHHEQSVRGAVRAERNMHRMVTGGVDDLDLTTVQTLEKVLNRSILSKSA
jgi:phage/plasmid-like protein (TIGR03299 family)